MAHQISEVGIETPGDYASLIELHFQRPDSDGIVDLPVTRLRLDAAVAATGRAAHDAVGAFPDRADFSVQDLAEVAMLAGCEPSYMPLILAVAETMLDEAFPVALLLRSRGSHFPYVIVNGPIRHQIGLNCRPNVFGPGFRANAAIGRALHRVLMRFGGYSPARSAIGNGYKFACVIGEDEEHSPWPALSAEAGFGASESIVTVMVGVHNQVISHQLSTRPEHLLATYAEEVSSVGLFDPLDVELRADGHRPVAVCVLAEDHRGYMRDAGWTRAMAQDYLLAATQRSAARVRAAGYHSDRRLLGKRGAERVGLYARPEDFLIVSAGSGGGRAMIGAAISPISRRIDMAPQPAPLPVKSGGLDDYVAGVSQLIDRKLTDGWPVVPAGADNIAPFIAQSGRSAEEVLGEAAWRSGPITVRDLAINAVMAGCEPAQMRLLCAMYGLLFSKQIGLGGGASTMGYNPWFIVHGPVARELGVNRGGGLFGPGVRANVSMGRAIRLGLMNLAGLKPDLVDRSCLGQAFKFGAVIAEDEAASPWGPLHATLGLGADQGAVSMAWVAHPRITSNAEAVEPEQVLRSIAESLSSITNFDSPSARGPVGGTAGSTLNDPGAWMRNRGRIVVIGEAHRRILEAAGWSRLRTQEALYEFSKRTVRDARDMGFETSPWIPEGAADDDEISTIKDADSIRLMFAGGPGPSTISVSTIAPLLSRGIV